MNPLILLALGGAAVLVIARGKGNGHGFLLVDANCQRVVHQINTQGQLVALIRHLAKVAARTFTALGYPMTPAQGASDEATGNALHVLLGPAPGDPEANMAFARAYAEEATRITTHPDCVLAQDGAAWPPAASEVAEGLFSEVAMNMTMDYGYDLGMQFSTAGGPRQTFPERLARRIAG